MPTDYSALHNRLVALVQRLQNESADFLDNHQDAQQWYNRGYANGMLAALTELGHAADLPADIVHDDAQLMNTHAVMSWGKAYRHGQEVGQHEVFEVLAPTQKPKHALS